LKRYFLSYILPYIGAVLLTALIASVFSTQFVVAGLSEVGVEIGLIDRLKMTVTDLAMVKLAAGIIAVGFLVGFLVATFGHNKFGGVRLYWLVAAGAMAWLCTLLLMSYQLQLQPIAGARSHIGLLLQMIAGGAGGYLFAKFSGNQAPE